MAHQIPWNKIILEEFISLSCLSKDEEAVIRTRVAGWTRTEQAMKLGMDLSTVDRHIRRLKNKYDEVQKFSAILPPRKKSVKETYLDTH